MKVNLIFYSFGALRFNNHLDIGQRLYKLSTYFDACLSNGMSDLFCSDADYYCFVLLFIA